MRPNRRILWAGAIAGLLLVVAAILVSQLLDERRVRSELERRLTALVGRPVAVRGPLEYALVPNVTFDVRGIEVAGVPGSRAPLATVARVRGGVRAGSVVSGRIEIGDVRLDGLRIALAVDAAGRGNWEGLFPGDPDTAAAADEPPSRWSLASLAIEDGAVAYVDARDDTRYALQDWRLRVGRVELPQPVELQTSGRAYVGGAERAAAELRARAAVDLERSRYGLDDVALDLRLVRERPLPVAVTAKRIEYASGDGGTAAIRALEARALGMRATLDLAADSLATAPRASGTLAVESFSPRALAGELGVSLPPTADPAVLARANLSAGVAYGAGLVRLDRLEAGVDDTRLEGDVAVKLEPREYRFELAADRIVAGRYLKPKALRDRTPVELPLEFLRGLPATGRLRVGELDLEGTKLKGVTIDLGEVAARSAR